MVLIRILAVVLSLTVLAAPAAAQWSVRTVAGATVAGATGEGGQIAVRVGCQDRSHAVTLARPSGVALRGGTIEARWDDGSTDRYTLRSQGGKLAGNSSDVQRLVTKLRQRSAVQILAAGGSGEVADLIHLTGSFRAIGSLDCGGGRRLTDDEIRRILIQQSLRSYSGSCPCPYNTDRGGRRCGGRSAYSRPGGASPLCYPSDISDRAVDAYRAGAGR